MIDFSTAKFMKTNFSKKPQIIIPDQCAALEKLRIEIAKGWDGPVSKRSVTDIIKDKVKVSK